MKKTVLIIIGLLFSSCVWSQSTVFCDMSLKNALTLAGKENKPILLFFYTKWCSSCKDLIREVGQNKELTETIKNNFIAIHFDAEIGEGREIFAQYSLRKSYPTSLVLAKTGHVIDYLCGWGLKEYLAFLNDAKDRKNTLSQLLSQYKNDQTNAKLAIKIAQKYASQSNYEKAIWYMTKALADPEQKKIAENNFLLSLYYLNSQQLPSAEIYLTEALHLDPSNERYIRFIKIIQEQKLKN